MPGGENDIDAPSIIEGPRPAAKEGASALQAIAIVAGRPRAGSPGTGELSGVCGRRAGAPPDRTHADAGHPGVPPSGVQFDVIAAPVGVDDQIGGDVRGGLGSRGIWTRAVDPARRSFGVGQLNPKGAGVPPPRSARDRSGLSSGSSAIIRDLPGGGVDFLVKRSLRSTKKPAWRCNSPAGGVPPPAAQLGARWLPAGGVPSRIAPPGGRPQGGGGVHGGGGPSGGGGGRRRGKGRDLVVIGDFGGRCPRAGGQCGGREKKKRGWAMSGHWAFSPRPVDGMDIDAKRVGPQRSSIARGAGLDHDGQDGGPSFGWRRADRSR